MRFRNLHTAISRPSRNRAITNAPPPRNPRRRFVPPAAKTPAAKPSSDKFTHSDIVRCTVAVRNHLRNRQFDAALRLFNSMPRKSTISYNTMISGCFSNGKIKQAQQLFDEMPVKDLFTHNIMIKGNIKNKDLGAALRLFNEMPEKDVVSWSTILYGYVHNGFMDEARRVFDEMPEKNVVSWNTILYGYVQSGFLDEARRVFDEMPVKDVVSWNMILNGYVQNGLLNEAKSVFDEMPMKDNFSWNTILCGHVRSGFMDEAKRVFDGMPMKDAVSWNAILCGYVQNGFVDEARRVFDGMPLKDVVSWNAILCGYVQNGFLDEARKVFDMMPQRNCSSWSTIIVGYNRNGDSEEALRIFIEAMTDRGRLSMPAFSSALSSCADITATELGKQIHGHVVKGGIESVCLVGNALVSMYSRCGSINEAYDVFKRIEDKDVFSWNTIIVGYARHGFGQEALQLFESMKQSSIQPDEVTMVAVLTACRRSSLVDKAKHYFYSMTQDHGIVANLKHYNCLIDLLGRAGLLDEAQNLMKSMPFEPNASTWRALLSASRAHGDTKLGEKAAEMLFDLEPWNSGNYILLSKLYAESGRWEDSKKTHARMRDSAVANRPGHSWVEVLETVHTFCAGDFTHPESEGIRTLLDELDLRMRQIRSP